MGQMDSCALTPSRMSDRANNPKREYANKLNCRANPRFAASGWFGAAAVSNYRAAVQSPEKAPTRICGKIQLAVVRGNTLYDAAPGRTIFSAERQAE